MAKIYDGSGNVVQLVDPFDTPIITSGLPTVFIESRTAFTSLTKDTAVGGTIDFVDGKSKFSLDVKMKLQGAHSLDYAKKNLNITFYNSENKKQKIKFNGWYPTNKVHLKANEYDYSMVRNSVGSVLAYNLCGKYLPTGARGYIDSFPIVLYYNDEYMGCYTLNLPQDGKTYNFSDSAETAGTNLAYRTTDVGHWKDSSYWEYRGDEDETASMRAVFDNSVIPLLNDASLTKAKVEAVFDVDTLVAYLAFAQISCAVDSLINNWTLVTWDGIKWYHTWYDLDICFGIGGGQDGKSISATKDVFTAAQGIANTFFAQVKTLYANELESMYANMRKHGADTDTLTAALVNFQRIWGQQNIVAERIKWASDKQGTADIDIVPNWLTQRFTYLDNLYNFSE